MLQIDMPLVQSFKSDGWYMAIESNGTLPIEPGIDWICISPKAGTSLQVTSGHELKLVYPQMGIDPADFLSMDFEHFSLQPMDSDRRADHTKACIDYCLAHPKWRLSVQTHKYIGID